LAQRLGVTRDAVWKLERAEADGRITLAKLEQIAEAMECRLVYAIVPRTTLRELVLKRARSAAQERLGYALHTMELEAQGVEPQSQAESLDRLAEELVDSGRLWS
jgi:predicted DNA-binding mobile mystery protein A